MSTKPLISILMAVYNAKTDWLVEQLQSLNAQTYPNLELLICDDCPDHPLEQSLVAESITNFPCEIVRNEKNVGSNKSFEKLTQMARGSYFAYCDQDDIWLPEKLSVLQREMEKDYPLVCSDVFVIDGRGKVVADSITKVRHRHVFYTGENQYRYFLTRNFVMGCTMLVKREVAVSAVPFVDEMVHDHWIALCAAKVGKICAVQQPLIKYRIHGGNQTGVLNKIDDKATYIEQRINNFYRRLLVIQNRLGRDDDLDKVISWVVARRDFANKVKGSRKRLYKLRKLNSGTTWFELLFIHSSNGTFKRMLKILKKH